MTHQSDHSGGSDWPAFGPGDSGVGSTYDPTGEPLTNRQANLWWILIVLVIGLLGFAVLWLPSILR